MRILKLVIWDLDETILEGVLEEGDREVSPHALQAMERLNNRGILQALASQNQSEMIDEEIAQFGWESSFIKIEADLGPKIDKVRRIVESLEIDERDVAFVDEDPFERDSISVQTANLACWNIETLANYLNLKQEPLSEESQQRPRMYRDEIQRAQDLKQSQENYEQFLCNCNIGIRIRPYEPKDLERVRELLTRTHRMNLGVLPRKESVDRLSRLTDESIMVAEASDRYGSMGRCGVMFYNREADRTTVIESLAISCRTRARGLSLALFVGMLRHPSVRASEYFCRFESNGSNRPLRMLLLAAKFKPDPSKGNLRLDFNRLSSVELPTWIRLDWATEERP